MRPSVDRPCVVDPEQGVQLFMSRAHKRAQRRSGPIAPINIPVWVVCYRKFFIRKKAWQLIYCNCSPNLGCSQISVQENGYENPRSKSHGYLTISEWVKVGECNWKSSSFKVHFQSRNPYPSQRGLTSNSKKNTQNESTIKTSLFLHVLYYKTTPESHISEIATAQPPSQKCEKPSLPRIQRSLIHPSVHACVRGPHPQRQNPPRRRRNTPEYHTPI